MKNTATAEDVLVMMGTNRKKIMEVPLEERASQLVFFLNIIPDEIPRLEKMLTNLTQVNASIHRTGAGVKLFVEVPQTP